MSEIVALDPHEALERAGDPGEFVVLALERGKSWLAEALAHGDLDALVNAKGYAETLRVAVVQKQLGKDAELSAQELVRRAERCIGLGIEAGRASGAVETEADARSRAGRMARGTYQMDDNEIVKAKRSDFVTINDWVGNNAGIYDLTDDVTDDQFEDAITEAKAEGNLSRANIVRKVKPRPAPAPDRSEWHHKARRINPERIVEETIDALAGLTLGLNLISVEDVQSLDAEKRSAWMEDLREPLAAINRLKKGLGG